MRVNRLAVVVVAVALAGAGIALPAEAWQGGAGDAVVIEMTAKKYEFAPAEVRLKKGQKVQLKITATDRDHGIEIQSRPDGAKKSDPEGLKFVGAENKWKLPQNQAVTIEFTAEQAGTYSLKCSAFCGMGHRGMKGKIVVE